MNALWSIRREVWENRSIYLVPLAAMVVLFALSINTFACRTRCARSRRSTRRNNTPRW